MYRFSLSLILGLFLAVSPAAGAVEEVSPAHLPNFDLVARVPDWLDASEIVSKAETGPGPSGLDEPPHAEMGPILEPNG